MKFNVPALLSLALLASAKPLVSRGLEKCKTLQANSNNGGRKIAVVIDESGSMSLSDPYNLRITAGKAVNDWLISSKEAGGGKAADLITVIGFDYSARLLYGLGDPGGADKAFDQISELGGTYIAGGIDEALGQLNMSGHDPTANRSGIVVLTDGEDPYTATLVDTINSAGQQGIRVSFGYLNAAGYSLSYQAPEVLSAILGTGGMYATIDGATAQNAFVNLMIVHGLTDNDNPTPDKSTTVYNGLSVAFVLGSDGTSTLTYTAQAGEGLTFTINSIAAGALNVTATDASGKEIGKANVSSYSYSSPEELSVTASSSGNLELKVQGEADQVDAVFVVGVNSSIPLVNCTLGDSGGKKGLSAGAKAGIGISVPLLVGLFAAGSYFAFKYWKGMPSGMPSGPTPSAPNQPPMTDYKQPYLHTTDLPTPSPQPTNVHPGWAMPPPKFPHAPNNGPQQQNPHNSQPDPNQQPFNQCDPSHPSQADPSHPSQADPSHPSQADPSHPAQADPSHPTQADPSHPTQADSSHPSQADPSHPTQADPSHPTQADPSHPTQADPNPNQPNHPTQADPNQPNQNPTNPQDPQQPHPHRLPTPRFPFRLLGRRKKKDDEDQNQNQSQASSQYQSQSTVTYPQPAYSAQSVPVQPQQSYQYTHYNGPPLPPPQPGYNEVAGSPPPQRYEMQGQSQSYTAPQHPQYQYTYQSNQSQQQPYVAPQAQYGQSYPSPSNIPLPQSLPGSPPPPGSVSPLQHYATPVQPQYVARQQWSPEEPNRDAYNGGPALQDADLAQPGQVEQSQAEIISPISTGTGSLSRKPVGGP